jgi:hypothetical protein
LDKALTSAETFVTKFISKLLFSGVSTNKEMPLPTLQTCRLSNESSCEFTQSAKVGDDILVVLYNALPRKVSQQVSVFLSDEALSSASSPSVMVLAVSSSDGKLTPVLSELIPTGNAVSSSSAPWTLVFNAEVSTISKFSILN